MDSFPKRPQLDALFIFPQAVDTRCFLYNSGFLDISKREDKQKRWGDDSFYLRRIVIQRRVNLETEQVEAIWLEIYPLKSKRSLILGCIYNPPSSKKDDHIAIEANVERIDILNKETIIVSVINIDYRNKKIYDKHRLSKGFRSMHFKQLVNFITRPVSKTCPTMYTAISHSGSKQSQVIISD